MTSDEDERLERAILDLLGRRRPDASVCPSEVARSVHHGADDGWRRLMEPTRAAAQRLYRAGLVEITQGGELVDPATVRGPIRIRRTR
ncbi:DUF3253 domain-containing protein [Streptomyces sp. NPDC102259]|uniref:DUF3253 domain-containing protein n=1 Tax=Streptomyces sp. NPDC102259 TaxID=3366148 RepID=UPI00382F03DE